MATPSAVLPSFGPAPVELASDTVVVRTLKPQLQIYLGHAAEVHQALFGKSLVITSGNDGQHADGSKHYFDKAADVRSRDLVPGQQLLFGLVLCYLAGVHGVAVFDEIHTASEHWHVELP